jgi:alkylation response protein AidB-like acyl-CoA dehydrogenase
MLEFSGEERQAICDTFDQLLSDNANEEALRKLIETESGFDNSLWQKMAELGLTGLMVDPDYDGIGANIQEAEALMEVAGKYLYNGPFISSCVVAPALLQASSNLSMVGPHLKNIASGNSIFAIAGCGQTGDWTQPPTVNAIQNADGWELSGPAHFITHALTASHCLVIANEVLSRQNTNPPTTEHCAYRTLHSMVLKPFVWRVWVRNRSTTLCI